MQFTQLVSALKHDNEVGIVFIQFAGRVKELAFHLIVFRLEETKVVTAFRSYPFNGCRKELRGGVTHQSHRERGKSGEISFQQFP